MLPKLTKVLFSLLTVSLLIIGCQEANIPNSPEMNPNNQQDVNTPPVGVNFLKSDLRINSGTLIASASEYLLPGVGGVVGGPATLNNMAEIPGNAFTSPTVFTIEVRQDNFYYVDFGPSMVFNKKVKVTFNTAFFGLSPEKLNKLKVYYFDPDIQQWVVVNGHYERTANSVSVWVKHFSRYGFAD